MFIEKLNNYIAIVRNTVGIFLNQLSSPGKLQILYLDQKGRTVPRNYVRLPMHVWLLWGLILVLYILVFLPTVSHSQSLDLAFHHTGVSFGNSKNFNGLRFNFRDRNVETITGLNVTIWNSRDNETARVRGISLGLYGPSAGYLSGIQLSTFSIIAEKRLAGFSLAPGVASGGDVRGITIGLLGAGAGSSMSGINVGGLGIGCDGSLSGVNIAGLGFGANNNIRGINIALLGMGAGADLKGLNIAGLGMGAGKNLAGISFALLGIGCGQNLAGIQVAGLGIGSGQELKWLSLAGIGVGAPNIKGITIAGIGVGGEKIAGLALALATVRVGSEGELQGLAFSAFNQIKGEQKGISLGIVNYAGKLTGIQIGLVNYVRNNPRFLKILPVVNMHF